jgi:hypothetical protein
MGSLLLRGDIHTRLWLSKALADGIHTLGSGFSVISFHWAQAAIIILNVTLGSWCPPKMPGMKPTIKKAN